MAKRHFEDWLRAFVEYASYGEAPLKNLWWTGVSTIAGALRRRVWIDMKYFQWVPNFYIVMVAPPGIVAKSTTANVGMNLLRPLKDIKFGPDAITWQALITSLGKATTSEPNPLVPGEFYPMSAVTFCSDELGNLLKPQDRDLVDTLVALWDGKRGVFSKETKMSGNDRIENPFVNVIGCTTPKWLEGSFPEYMIGGGFTSRCVFIYAEEKRQLIEYPDEHVPANFDEFGKKLTEDLNEISKMFGQFEITPKARDWGRAWYQKHWKVDSTLLTTEQFEGYKARKQTHLHKLAMVLSASQSSSLKIEVHHMEAADAFATALEEDMPKVFSRIGTTEITRGSRQIIGLVEARPGITQTEIFKVMFRTLSYKDFVESLNGAINTLQIRSLTSGNDIKYYPTKVVEPPEGGSVH